MYLIKRLLALLIVVLATGLIVAFPQLKPAMADGPWYVSPSGDDGNDCLSTSSPCATINAAIVKAVAGDTIYVSAGEYTGTGNEVVLLDKDVTLSGGWDAGFSERSGASVIDGEDQFGGIRIPSGISAIVEYFAIENGSSCSIGGGGIFNEGDLTLNNAAVSGSTSCNSSGGGIQNEGELVLTNSTVSGNNGNWGGGIYNIGNLKLNNSTISNNTASGGLGGGISNNFSDTVMLQNSIVAGNMGASPDCSAGIGSLGYNLIGITTGCSFATSTGDLVNIDAKLFPLTDSPGFHALLPDSPAIDAGNPLGCTDDLGNPLPADQRGVSRVGRCDMGVYEFDPANDPIRSLFLPLIARDFCPGFFDDFSDPDSGWIVVDDAFVRSEYVNGEYRILSKQSGFIYLFPAPACGQVQYVVETDVRWVDEPGADYGLVFGIAGDYDSFNLLRVNSVSQQYRTFRQNSGGGTCEGPLTGSGAINPGNATNHLKVTVSNSIVVEINGVEVRSWCFWGNLNPTFFGIASGPFFDLPVSDARFDNFSVSRLPIGGAGLEVFSDEQQNQPAAEGPAHYRAEPANEID